MTGRLPSALALCFASIALGFVACDGPEPMPLEPSATWLIETPPVAAGNPFEMVLFVRTPPGHRAHAYVPPRLDDIEVVERRILPISTEGAAVVHREALLARVRSAGLHRWPASEIRVTDAAGDTYALGIDALEFDVPSVLGEGAPPRRPRGYRPAPSAPLGGGFGAGFAAGALATGALALPWIRRVRRRARAAAATGSGHGAPTRRYIGGPGRLRRGLEAARAAVPAQADRAAAEAALALRFWAADRFLVSTHAASTEELLRARPARASEADWQAWIARLDEIECARFAERSDDARAHAIARAIDAALELVDAVDRPLGARGDSAASMTSGTRHDGDAAADAVAEDPLR
jgi:hypothetical protein